jgi:hypothetical protein
VVQVAAALVLTVLWVTTAAALVVQKRHLQYKDLMVVLEMAPLVQVLWALVVVVLARKAAPQP